MTTILLMFIAALVILCAALIELLLASKRSPWRQKVIEANKLWQSIQIEDQARARRLELEAMSEWLANERSELE